MGCRDKLRQCLSQGLISGSTVGNELKGEALSKPDVLLATVEAASAFQMRVKKERRFMANRRSCSNSDDTDTLGSGFEDFQADPRRQMCLKCVRPRDGEKLTSLQAN